MHRVEAPSRAGPSPDALGDLSPHPTSTPGQMKRELRREWDLEPFSPRQLRAARSLVHIVSTTKSRPYRAKAKKMFAAGLAALCDGRAQRARERRAKMEKDQLEKAEKERLKKTAIGEARKAEKKAIAEREIAPKMAPVIMVGKRAKATVSPPSASTPLQPAAFDDDSDDDCVSYPFVLEATAVSEPK